MKKVNLDKRYRCVGENFKNSIQIGFCGDEKRLIDFMMICFYGHEEDYIRNYFHENTEKEVLEYLLVNGGKRLVRAN